MWSTIVTNLVSNAMKYTARGGIQIRLTATDTDAVLTVADTGGGIDADQQSLVFDRFYRAPERRGRAPGSGWPWWPTWSKPTTGTSTWPAHRAGQHVHRHRPDAHALRQRPSDSPAHSGGQPPRGGATGSAAGRRGRHRPAGVPDPAAHRRRVGRAGRRRRRDRAGTDRPASDASTGSGDHRCGAARAGRTVVGRPLRGNRPPNGHR